MPTLEGPGKSRAWQALQDPGCTACCHSSARGQGFSIYYSIYCSRCCLPGVGEGVQNSKRRKGNAQCGTELPLC